MSAQDRALEQRDRVDWYLREHGRPPTHQELLDLRAERRSTDPAGHARKGHA